MEAQDSREETKKKMEEAESRLRRFENLVPPRVGGVLWMGPLNMIIVFYELSTRQGGKNIISNQFDHELSWVNNEKVDLHPIQQQPSGRNHIINKNSSTAPIDRSLIKINWAYSIQQPTITIILYCIIGYNDDEHVCTYTPPANCFIVLTFT